MRADPVHDHPQSSLVAAIDEACETVRPAVPRGGGVQAERLIAPRTAERMLADRQQFDMGEAQARHVGNELVAELVPVEHVAIVTAPPGTGVHFIDGDRAVIHRCARLHPGVVLPCTLRPIGHYRGRARQQLGLAGHRVGLVGQPGPVGCGDLELVARAGLHARQEDLPHASAMAQPHRVTPPVPAIEVAHHRNTARVRGPDGETHAIDALLLCLVCTQRHADAVRVASGDAGQRVLVQHGAEGVNVFDLLSHATPIDPQQAHHGPLDGRLEDALAHGGHRPPVAGRVAAQDRECGREQHVQAPGTGGITVGAQQREGIARRADGNRRPRRQQRRLGQWRCGHALTAGLDPGIQFPLRAHARASVVR